MLKHGQVFYLKALKRFGVKAPNESGEVEDADSPEVVAALRGSAVSVLYNLGRLHEQMRELVSSRENRNASEMSCSGWRVCALLPGPTPTP